MESNEQTELTRKMRTDIDGEQDGSWLVEGWSKKEKGLMDNSVVIAGRRGS